MHYASNKKENLGMNFDTGTSKVQNHTGLVTKKTFATTIPERTVDPHTIGGLRAQLKPGTWSRELEYLDDERLRNFLWEGVNNGFSVIDDNAVIKPYDCKNYRSAAQGAAQEFISNLMNLTWGTKKL